MCILSVYALLKVVGYYNLNVLSMSVMGIQFFWDFWNFLTLQSPLGRLRIKTWYFPGKSRTLGRSTRSANVENFVSRDTWWK